ncbi:MAG: DNA polymerase III subunit gamma/tau [Clostridiales bacterium]|nr:DNA polymerase III subunit gamma/tau [Clostridiales bacterium]
MSYTALYRKFRPQTFDDVIGQEYIVRTLKNQMISGRVSHAYLFCGTRGTGKTSTAKIFARAINCLEQKDGEPCNHCTLCMAMNEGRSMNVIEIDAASNNGVDNIREIRDEVKYPPTEGKYKVYIIDEVHMLSAGAFNALLKTLEEPPAHVIFILATTDPQKVPATILSRCQRYDFRRISTQKIVDTMERYLTQEGFDAEERALHYIATLADGSMRDALSILDQCLAFYYQEKVTLEKVLDIMGASDNSVFYDMTEALRQKNTEKVLGFVDELLIQGRDINQFVAEFIIHLRNLLVSVSVSKPELVLDCADDEVQRLKEQANHMTSEELMYLIRVLTQLSSELKYAGNGRILLEVTLMKLCSSFQEQTYDALAARISRLEKRLKNGEITFQEVSVNPKPPTVSVSARREKAVPEDIKRLMEEWKDIISEVQNPLRSILDAIRPDYMEREALELVCHTVAGRDLVQNKVTEIQQLLNSKYGKEFKINCITSEEFDRWHRQHFGEKEDVQEDDLEFASLLTQFIPDAEIDDKL